MWNRSKRCMKEPIETQRDAQLESRLSKLEAFVPTIHEDVRELKDAIHGLSNEMKAAGQRVDSLLASRIPRSITFILAFMSALVGTLISAIVALFLKLA